MSTSSSGTERGRGILTKRDRRFLLGQLDDELDQNARNQKRYRIRKQIQNAILDFQLIAQNLPVTDIQQVFEPLYGWSIKKRKLEERGRELGSPDLPEVAFGWLAMLEFFSYGMHAGGKSENRGLLQGIIKEGVERGGRNYQLQNSQFFQEVEFHVELLYGEQILLSNYLRSISAELPKNPDEIAEQIIKWYRERRIPYDTAVRWIEYYVRHPSQE